MITKHILRKEINMKLGLILMGSGVALRCGATQLNRIKVKVTDTAKSRKSDKLFDIDTKSYMTDQEIVRLEKLGVHVNPKDYSVYFSNETLKKLGGSIPVEYKLHITYRFKKKVIKTVGDFLVITGLLLALNK